MQQGYTCPKCRQGVQYGQAHCINCGCQLNWTQQPIQPQYQQQMSAIAPKKKSNTVVIFLSIIAGILLLGIGSCAICLSGNSKSILPPETIAPKKSTSTTNTFNPITLKGTDSETTSPFTVTTKEWIIEWSYSTDDPEYAIFGFFIYPRGETERYAEAVLFPKVTNGTTYSYAGPGEYYIKTNVGNITQWEIIIRPAE